MISQLKSIRENYLKDNGLYKGSVPNIDISEVTDEDVVLHTSIKTVSEINALREENRSYSAAILSSINTIKYLFIFWSILGIIGLIYYIINIIKLSSLY